MTNLIKSFSKSESGAMTTEFMVLIAAIVGLGVASVSGIERGTTTGKDVDVNDTLERFVSGG